MAKKDNEAIVVCMDKLKLTVTFAVNNKKIYKAWLDSKKHSAMTGARATASAKVNGKFTAWDGYISGKNLEIKENKKIVQSWRSSDFPVNATDSLVEITLTPKPGGKTQLTLMHTNIPKGQGKQYLSGWKDYYFEPMKLYFLQKK